MLNLSRRLLNKLPSSRVPPPITSIFSSLPKTLSKERDYKTKYILSRSGENKWRDASYVEHNFDNMLPGFKEGFGLFLLYVIFDQTKKALSPADDHHH